MKQKDCKRLSQVTESTSAALVRHHILADSDSEAQDIKCRRIKNFYKVRTKSQRDDQTAIGGSLSAKQNNMYQHSNIIYSHRLPKTLKTHTQEVQTRHQKPPQHFIPVKSIKKKHNQSRPQISLMSKSRQYNPDRVKKLRTSLANSGQSAVTSLNSTGRQLIMSTMDHRKLEEYLSKERSFEKLRSITQEESEVILKARKLSQRKLKKKATTCKSGHQTVTSKIQSYFTTQQLSKAEESFEMFRESIDQQLSDQNSNDSIESIHLDQEQFDNLGLRQLRLFEVGNPKVSLKHRLTEKSLKDISARKIQECWRLFRTQCLLSRYIKKEHQRAMMTQQFLEVDAFDINGLADILWRDSFQLEPRKSISSRVYFFSHQDEDQQNPISTQKQELSESNYLDIIKRAQMEEGKKWAQIPELISAYLSKNYSQADTRSLLERIATLSERNREELYRDGNTSQEQSHRSSVSSKPSDPDLGWVGFQKYRQLVSQQMVSKLVRSRKSMLRQRQKVEIEILGVKLESSEISEEEYVRKRQAVRERVVEERDQIEITRRYLEIGYQRARESIKKTQIDYSRMMRMKGKSMKLSYSQGFLQPPKYKKSHLGKTNSKLRTDSEINQKHNGTDQQGQMLLTNRESIQQIRKKLESLESQRSNVSLISNQLPQRGLRRESNTPLHKIGIDDQFSESDDDSLDFGEMQSLTLQIKIKNWIDRLQNRQEAKNNLVGLVFEDLIAEVCRQVQESEIDAVVYRWGQNHDDGSLKGVQTDVYTVKHFVSRIKQHVATQRTFQNMKTVNPGSEILQRMRSHECTLREFMIPEKVFDEVWRDLSSQLEFQEHNEVNKLFLEDIAYKHYRSIFDATNELLEAEVRYLQPAVLPWKVTSHFHREKLSESNMQQCVDTVESRVVCNASYLCGIHPESVNISGQDLEYVRGQRMQRMISLEMMDSQPYSYQEQELQISLEMQHFVLSYLIRELGNQRVLQ